MYDKRFFTDRWIKDYRVRGAPKVYAIVSNQAGGIDIKGRIETAVRFVNTAHEMGVISTRYPLMVVGGGVAGVAATIAASELEVPVTLLERRRRPFWLQLHCKSRWLHPNQYTWPAEGYENPNFPKSGSRNPLPWQAGFSNRVAIGWLNHFASHLASNPRVQLRFGSEITIKASDDVSKYTQLLSQCNAERKHNIILLCTGFREKHTVGSFKGFRFWSTDPFDQRFFGTKGLGLSILVSGGGDGAQQDLLRLAWDVPPVSALRLIEVVARKTRDGRRWWRKVVLSLDAQARRPSEMPGRKHFPEGFFARLLDIPLAIWQPLHAELRRTLRPEFQTSHVTFAFAGSEPPPSFPLNRFLSEILNKFCVAEYGRTLFRPDSELIDAKVYEQHRCNTSPELCHGRMHEVILRSSTGASAHAFFNIIIVRHGIEAELQMM